MSRTGDLITLSVIGGAVALVGVTLSYKKLTPFDADFDEVGKSTKIDPDMLRAIAHQETGGKFDPSAISPPNKNGTKDFGLMQINEVTAKKLGVEPAQLVGVAGARLSIETAAKLLNLIKQELGTLFSPWTWVAAYNAGAPAIRQRGVFNVAYASGVMFHWTMYKLQRGQA